MNELAKSKKKIDIGDIFIIPLFLPFGQFEDLIDYRKYPFRRDDPYAFGRLIDIDMGNCNLIEVFQYVGTVPDTPEIIINSGRMFAPVFMVLAFGTKRWRFLFDNPHYDKWTDSDYENIMFRYPVPPPRIWKGGKDVGVTQQQFDELIKAGVEYTTIYSGIQIEDEIRTILKKQGLELNYEKIVEERRGEYPQRRDMDKKLKQAIAPFRWLSESRRYCLSLDAGELNQACFEKYHLLGNGYDWERIATAFWETYMPELKANFTFDCEADLFCMQSGTKKALKEFALAFHQFSMDVEAFENLCKSAAGQKDYEGERI